MQCGGLVCDSPGVSGTAHNDRTYSHSMTQLNVFAFLQQNGQLFTLRGLNKELLIASVRMRFHHQIRVTFSCKISLQNKQQTTFSFRAFRISTESTGEHSVITLRNDSSVETGGRTRWKQCHPQSPSGMARTLGFAPKGTELLECKPPSRQRAKEPRAAPERPAACRRGACRSPGPRPGEKR